jgi:Uncharacterized conserved protein
LAQMVEVVIDSVRVSLTNQQRIVLLRQENLDRYLPIWIGPFEAESITISLQEIEVARPQTHDLLLKSIVALGARLIRVEVIALKGDVFYGNLVLEVNGETVNVDARPSDSIALAVRAHVPILVNREIMLKPASFPKKIFNPNCSTRATTYWMAVLKQEPQWKLKHVCRCSKTFYRTLILMTWMTIRKNRTQKRRIPTTKPDHRSGNILKNFWKRESHG